MPLYTSGGKYYFQSDPKSPALQVDASGGSTYNPNQATPLPSGLTTIPFGATYNIGGNDITNPYPSYMTPPASASASGANSGGTGTGDLQSMMKDYLEHAERISSTMMGNIQFSQGSNADQISRYQKSIEDEQATLRLEEAQALADQEQANQADTSGIRQTAAILSRYTSMNTALADLYHNMETNHQKIMSSLKSQYEVAIQNVDAQGQAKIADLMHQQQQDNQQQMSQLFQTNMSMFNAAAGVLNQQTQTDISKQQLQLQQSSFDFQKQQQDIQNKTTAFNAVLANAGSPDLKPEDINQAVQLGATLGIPESAVRTAMSSKTIAFTATVTDPFGGSTVLFKDKYGRTISSKSSGGFDSVGGGGSSPYVTDVGTPETAGGLPPPPSDPKKAAAYNTLVQHGLASPSMAWAVGGYYVSKDDLSLLPAPQKALAAVLVNKMGGKILSPTQVDAVSSIEASYGNMKSVANALASVLPKDVTTRYTQWANRSIASAIQSDPALSELNAWNIPVTGALLASLSSGRSGSTKGISILRDKNGQLVATIDKNETIGNLLQTINVITTDLQNKEAPYLGKQANYQHIPIRNTEDAQRFLQQLNGGHVLTPQNYSQDAGNVIDSVIKPQSSTPQNSNFSPNAMNLINNLFNVNIKK